MTEEERILIFDQALSKAKSRGYSGVLMSPEQAYKNMYEIIFNYGDEPMWSFPKAFWGEEQVNANTGEKLINMGISSHRHYSKDKTVFNYLPAWQYHLQQIVLEKDKIKYLKKFL